MITLAELADMAAHLSEARENTAGRDDVLTRLRETYDRLVHDYERHMRNGWWRERVYSNEGMMVGRSDGSFEETAFEYQRKIREVHAHFLGWKTSPFQFCTMHGDVKPKRECDHPDCVTATVHES